MKIDISFDSPLQLVFAQPGVRAVFAVQYEGVNFKGENMSSEMKSGTIATLSVQWNDKGGNAVPVDGPTSWESSDPSILKVEVSTGNSLISNVYSQGPIGTATIQASADADMGQGVRTVYATYDIVVVKGDAVGGDITFTQYPQQNPPGPNVPVGRK